MPQFGRQSKEKRDECHPKLRAILDSAINRYDFSVIEGHRDRDAQNEAYNGGYSEVKWPNSKHNVKPSRAFDVVPYPGGFDNPDAEFYVLASHIFAAASELGVGIRWGGHFNGFFDGAHFELRDDE